MDVVENKREYLSNFIQLNEEWIITHFEIEEADRKLAENPGKIIDDGGYIFSLVLDEEIAGVCALINKSNGLFELARMAVSPKHHRSGYGEKLMKLCLAKLKEINAKKVYLLSNKKLNAALMLYKKYGFQIVSEEQHPVYSRANVIMEKNVL